MKNIIYIFICFISFMGCKDATPKSKTTQTNTPKNSIPVVSLVSLESYAKKELKTWQEYQALQEFVIQFSKINSDEIKANALELKSFLKPLKESFLLKELNTPSFRARIHVFENEVLRLCDMTYISVMTSIDFHMQRNKVLKTFNSINLKINAVFLEKTLEENIKDAEILKD